MPGLSAADLSIDERTEAIVEEVEAFDGPRTGRLEADAVLIVHA